MKYLGLFLLTVCILLAQIPTDVPSDPQQDEPEVKLPNGKSQKDEIIRVDYERNLKDAGDLARLAEEIKDDLEKGDRYLVSLEDLEEAGRHREAVEGYPAAAAAELDHRTLSVVLPWNVYP